MIECLSIGECMAELGPPDGDGNRRFSHGGDTLNTATYMARLLGPGRVAYGTRLGDDPFSRDMLAAWKSEGVNTDLVECVPGRSVGLYAITVDGRGERSFTYWRECAPARELFLEGTVDALASAIRTSKMVYYSGITLAVMSDAGRRRMLDILDQAKQSGTVIAYDPNFRASLWSSVEEASNWTSRAYASANILLSSAEEEAAIFGNSDVFGRAPGETVLKNGADPCIVRTEGQSIEIAPEHTVLATDTTGAGDSFNAGYLSARLKGASPQEAAKAGHALAGIVVQHPGAIVVRGLLPT